VHGGVDGRGGVIKGGSTFGATDELGGAAVDNVMDIHDSHATILVLLGLDHERFIDGHNGRDFRLTNAFEKEIKEGIA
jgi:hypothetical protein